ncbi:MAG: hypothetical protein IKK57_07805 [Clostridia bacterium]|nr:hypothetical protein [Clostridia bacterium]
MEFFKSIFSRKEKPQNKAAEAPQQPAPAVQPAAPAVSINGGDAIRNALDKAMHALISDPAEGAQDVGRRLSAVRAMVEDCTCDYRDYDETLVKAAEQIPSFCLKNADGYAQVNDYVNQLEAAIRARSYTKESISKYEPQMDTHYYQLKLIYLRGHLYTLQIEMTEKQQWLDNINAKSPEEQAAYLIPKLTCQGYLNSAEMQKKNLNSQIAAYDAGLINARHMLMSGDSVDPIKLTEIFQAINAQSEQYQKAMINLDHERIMYLTKFAAQTEGQLEATGRHHAAEKQQELQVAEIEALQNAIAANIGKATQTPAAQVQAPQAQAPQAQPAASEPTMPTM